MKARRTIKDTLSRTYLSILNAFRYWFKKSSFGSFVVPNDYKLQFGDTFSTMNAWDKTSEWGLPPYHPNNMLQWYDDEQVKLVPDGIEFNAILKEGYDRPNAIGMIRSKDSWKYGIFKFNAKLPKGTYLWPALWFSGKLSWPPEIDLLEAYSDETLDNHKNKKLQSNIHYTYGNEQQSFGGTNHWLPVETTEKFVEYTLWWEKDFIKIFYNGYMVLHVTNTKVLDGMFEEQKVIIGNGTQDGFNKNCISAMIVKSLRIYQKINEKT